MWNKNWKYGEGFVFGTILMLIGEILQLIIGGLTWSSVHYPINIILFFSVLVVVIATYSLRNKFHFCKWMGTVNAAVPCLFFVILLTVVMGLTRQVPTLSEPSEPIGITKMLSFWPFVLVYLWMTIIVGVVTLKQLSSIISHLSSLSSLPSPLSSLLSHAGLFIILTVGTLGNADMRRVKMYAIEGEQEWRAVDEQQKIVELPLTIQLNKFIMEEWDDNSSGQHMPKRFASEVSITTKKGEKINAVIDVNKPISVEGWRIYQYDYDQSMGADCDVSIFELVRDPWMPVVYVGIYMLLAGAVLTFVISLCRKGASLWPKRRVFRIAVACAGLFIILMYIYSIWSLLTKPLVPVLQSSWFVPHIAAYMFAYALLGAATIMAIFGSKPSNIGGRDELVAIGWAFLTVGMLFGALWAKDSWGHYWEWDPKETWAACTWFVYLAYIHLRLRKPNNDTIARWTLIIAFVLLQMCWWGINFLPSAQGTSVHTYT